MSSVFLYCEKLNDLARLPTKGSMGAACLDLYSTQDVDLEVGKTTIVGTGLAMEIPSGCAGLIFTRSSMLAKHGVLKPATVIDSDYRGEVGVPLFATAPWHVHIGDRIAQIMIIPLPDVMVVPVAKLSMTERGSGGYGSTGR